MCISHLIKALQKWYDWRGRIARRAQSALKTALERFKPADRLAYAEWLLSDGMPCMWQNAAEVRQPLFHIAVHSLTIPLL